MPLLSGISQKWEDTMRSYPRAFRMLVIIMFVDAVGSSIMFPFFALYLTSRFNVGMTEAGFLFTLLTLSGLVGSGIGGALTDRLGRKRMIVISLLSSSLSALTMGFLNSFNAFLLLALLVGLFRDIGMPAYQAMVADLLPEDRRTSGYGILRVVINLSVVIGPAIGGFLASRSYLLIFASDAVISLVSALAVAAAIPETMPQRKPGAARESLFRTFRGYGRVFTDRTFILFCGGLLLLSLAYNNINTTLGVYLRDANGLAESHYGWLLSLNAGMVVLLQMPISEKIKGLPLMRMLALGSLLVGIGLAMFGLFSAYPLFLAAMAVLTVGEMIFSPISQALAANFAPESMRGRYMAIFGYAWSLPNAFGPLLAGMVIDNLNPRWLWYGAGLLAMFSGAGFWTMHHRGRVDNPEEPARPVAAGSI